MKLLGNLSIAQKLYGSFGFVVALLVVVLAVSLSGMGRLGAENDAIATDATPKLVSALTLKYDGAELHGHQVGYVLDHGKSRDDFEHESGTFRADLAHLRKLSIDAEDKQSIATVEKAYEEFACDSRVPSDPRAPARLACARCHAASARS